MASVSHAAVLLTLSCVSHIMTVFDTVAKLLKHSNNGDVISMKYVLVRNVRQLIGCFSLC